MINHPAASLAESDFFQMAYKGLNDWWRYLVGIVAVVTGYMAGQMFLYGAILWRMYDDPSLGQEALGRFEKTMDFSAVGVNKNLGLVLLIMMFVVAMTALIIVIRSLHDKKLLDVITHRSAIDWKRIFFGFGFWLFLSLLLEGATYVIYPGSYTFRWNAAGFLPLMVISLTLLPVQTSFEEIFFRGYIMQGLGVLTHNKWIPVLVSSIMFGLMHGTNPEVAKFGFWTMQLYYVIAGLFLAVITVMDDGLELALGVHAATNFFGATLFSYEGGVLQTDSLFITSEVRPWLMTLGFVIAALIFTAISKRKYGWPPFDHILQPVHKPETVLAAEP